MDKIIYPKAKVMKGLEIIGSWESNIRALVNGDYDLEIRCSIFAYINKKDPVFVSDVMTEDIDSSLSSLFKNIEIMCCKQLRPK